MAPHGCVTLKVGGEERSFAIEDGATASVLFDAMGGELEASTVKLLHKGRRLERDTPLAAGMLPTLVGTVVGMMRDGWQGALARRCLDLKMKPSVR